MLTVNGIPEDKVRSLVSASLRENVGLSLEEHTWQARATIFENLSKIREHLLANCFGQDEVINAIVTQLSIIWRMPPDDDRGTSFVNKWPIDKISLSFIEKLRRMKIFLSRQEPTSEVDVGFIASTKTINTLQKIMDLEGISDFILFSCDNLQEKLKEIYEK